MVFVDGHIFKNLDYKLSDIKEFAKNVLITSEDFVTIFDYCYNKLI